MYNSLLQLDGDRGKSCTNAMELRIKNYAARGMVLCIVGSQGRSSLGAVSRLRRVKSKAPALQRSGFCKAAVETGRAPSLHVPGLEPNVIKLRINSYK
jgi:hypothetical protein